ncbi:hypothetical protein ACFVXE_02565 [Streptomyces sp. NPDC058231]|uniref:hypothetical protein n=1 Tax=Streptomyces sp. NPDC058231 TaxID=3346392 RepID=UPI0036E44B38
MGIFSRFRRSSSGTVESSAEVPPALTADAPPEAPADRSAASAGREPAEGVDIPKQQSAGEAADNEAADDART